MGKSAGQNARRGGCVPPKSHTENESGTFGFVRSLEDAIAMAASESGSGSTVRSIPSVESVSPVTWVSSSPSFFLPGPPSENSEVVARPIVPNPLIVCLRFLLPPERRTLRALNKLVLPTFSVC